MIAAVANATVRKQGDSRSMEQIKLEVTSGDLLSGNTERTWMGELLHSAAYAGGQTPVSGAAQLFDKAAGTESCASLQFVDAPVEREFLSSRWHAQQIGATVGMIVPFLLVHKAVNGVGNAMLGKAEAGLGSTLFTRRAVGESALTGAIMEGVFRPVNTELQPDFLRSRFENAVTGAVTMGVLTGGSIGLQSAFRQARNLAARLASSDIGSAMISGVPAGVVHAELASKVSTGEHASFRQHAESVYSFCFLGGALASSKVIASRMHEASAPVVADATPGRSPEVAPSLAEPTIEAQGAKNSGKLAVGKPLRSETSGGFWDFWAPSEDVPARTGDGASLFGFGPARERPAVYEPFRSTPAGEAALREFYPQLTNETVMRAVVARLKTALEQPLWTEDLRPKLDTFRRERTLEKHFAERASVFRRELGQLDPASAEQVASMQRRVERFEEAAAKHKANAAEVKAEVKPKLSARARDWARAFNDAIAEHQLPAVGFKAGTQQNPAYYMGTAGVDVGLFHFASRMNITLLAKSTVHEYLHFMQDLAVVRLAEVQNAAGEAPVAVAPTIDQVRTSYEQLMGVPLRNRLLATAQVENAKGNPVPAAEALDNAAKVAEAYRVYPTGSIKRHIVRAATLAQWIETIRDGGAPVESLFAKLSTSEGSGNIFKPGEVGIGLQKRLFPHGNIPEGTRTAMEAWSSPAPGETVASAALVPEAARELVLADLRSQLERTNRVIGKRRDAYFGNYLERQTYTLESMFGTPLQHGLQFSFLWKKG